ncbi:hypothetical protein, partial [Mesorhizobium sp. M4B.F.Ca.ET.089.01.1.1]|uniref:hypothetical protein n=1 Tax=Mesorhizobium sp. M4B.F.Ca.ET.089.01.1.1 TaxID=2496662 RepID=UPI001AECBCC2
VQGKISFHLSILADEYNKEVLIHLIARILVNFTQYCLFLKMSCQKIGQVVARPRICFRAAFSPERIVACHASSPIAQAADRPGGGRSPA